MTLALELAKVIVRPTSAAYVYRRKSGVDRNRRHVGSRFHRAAV